MSLSEIMLAFVILSLAVLPASSLISYGHQGTQKDYRNVKGLELLVDRMNQVSGLPYDELDKLITSGNFASFSTPLFVGTKIELQLGEVNYQGSFTASLSLERYKATFRYNPIDLDLSYNSKNPTTWKFKNAEDEVFDGGANPYKIIRAYVSVVWKERGARDNGNRMVDATTFIVDLED